MSNRRAFILAGTALAGLGLATLGFTAAPQDNYSRLRGDIKINGSSTVYLVTEAVSEEFRKVAPNVNVTVGVSGTGGGFKRFVVGDTDISDASRPIKAKEYEAAKAEGIEFIEVPVAYDGLSIVVNPENNWVDYLTVDELKKIFLDGSTVDSWNDVRASWPDSPLTIFSPGLDSGTFDYFKEVVAGSDGAIRSDMSVSEDDNILVNGVSGNKGALGFFGVAYYENNRDQLKVVPIMNPELQTPVEPTSATIESGEYAPFSRPLFIYVNANAVRKPHVRGFVDFYLDHAAELSAEVGYVRLPESVYDAARRRIQRRITGTAFLDENMEKVHGPVTEVYK